MGFSFGFTGEADDAIRWHVLERVRHSSAGGISCASAERFGYTEVFGEAGVVDILKMRLRRRPVHALS